MLFVSSFQVMFCMPYVILATDFAGYFVYSRVFGMILNLQSTFKAGYQSVSWKGQCHNVIFATWFTNASFHSKGPLMLK